MAKLKAKKNIPLAVALFWLILIMYNQIAGFLASFGLKENWQVNFFLLGILVIIAYRWTPYIDAIVRGN